MIKLNIILLYLLYPLVHFQLFAIGNFGVTTSDIFILILNNVFLYKFVWEGTELKIPKTSIHILILLLIVFLLFSGIIPLLQINEGYIIQFLKTYSHFLYLYIFLLFGISFEIDEKFFFKVIQIILISSILVNLYGIYQLVARALDLPWGWVEINNASLLARTDQAPDTELKQLALQFKDFYRATSIFSEPSAFVHYNLHNLVFLAIPFLSKTKKIFESKFLNILIFLLILINLFLTFSLTAILGLSFLVFISAILEKKTLLKLYLKILLISAIVLLLADYYIQDIVGLSLISLIGDRIYSVLAYIFLNEDNLVDGESLTWRITVVMDSIEVWLKNPFGVGSGLYAKNSEIANFSDNSLLAILSEAGPHSASVFIGLFVSLFYHTIKLRRNANISKNEIQSTFVNMLPYIMIIQFETNFLTANTYITVPFVLPLFFILSVIRSVYISNSKYYSFKFSTITLKAKFNENISKYIKNHSISAQ